MNTILKLIRGASWANRSTEMKKRNVNLVFAVASLTLAAQSTVAQSSSESTTAEDDSSNKTGPRVETIMVEGQKMDFDMSEMAVDAARYGTQVQIIDSQEIDTGGFTNFGELAAGLIRGANIGYSPDEGEFTIRIDGGTDRDTLLLLDGVPTFDRGTPLESLWGATALDPRMIDRVEVFRGGQSLYYGGNGGLGVVNVRYKKPEADSDLTGEIGFYGGSFKTREMYGNVSTPIFGTDNHYLMFFGRSYETDAHEMFSEEAYTDNVLALGGKHEFPYTYNLLGAKYYWDIDEDTDFRASYQLSTIDFRDSFPNTTVFQPNYTEFPMFDMDFKTRFSDLISFAAEAYYTAPTLKNSEVDARVCHIPRVQDLPESAQGLAADQGITEFANASEFESFAATVDSVPAGCVTNPYGDMSRAATSAREGFYVDDEGNPYGTIDNPFPIGAPIGYVIQSTAGFGSGAPTKGFGAPNQFTAGYVDYGLNTRLKMEWSDHLETVLGVQNTTYKDNSDDAYGMSDDSVSSTGVYADMRFNLDVLEGTSLSVAARNDFNNSYEDQTIWKYGLRQEFGRGVYFRSNGGTSYSNPTLTEIGARKNTINNPNLETQEVETYSLGLGVNGEIFTGTYNVEIGYFDTVISKLYGSAQLENVCPSFAEVPEDINPDIITPTAFCESAQREGLEGTETAYFNRRREQDIEGITLDIAYDFDQWQLDFSFTDMDSLEPNPNYQRPALEDGTGEPLDFFIPGAAGNEEFRQSGERPEWSASALVTYTPTSRWVVSLNGMWQGPEWAHAGGRAAALVDDQGARTNPDLNFGDYFVLNGSVQYFMGNANQHRFMLRAVNILDEDYYERASNTDRRASRAGVRNEIGENDSDYYYQYGWNGKPRSFWLQYEYQF